MRCRLSPKMYVMYIHIFKIAEEGSKKGQRTSPDVIPIPTTVATKHKNLKFDSDLLFLSKILTLIRLM